MTEFLTKNADVALVKVKEKLYDRLSVLRQCLGNAEKDDWGYIDHLDHHMANEMEFLQNLLDLIERS